MKPRFPLSHRARYQKQKDHGGENPNHKGGRSSDRRIDDKTETDPAVSSCRDPAVLVDAGHRLTFMRGTEELTSPCVSPTEA
jgi:hypothetical protein